MTWETSNAEDVRLSDVEGAEGVDAPAAFVETFYRFCVLSARSEASTAVGKAKRGNHRGGKSSYQHGVRSLEG